MQNIIVWVIVGLVILRTGWLLHKALTSKTQETCGGCPNCAPLTRPKKAGRAGRQSGKTPLLPDHLKYAPRKS